MNFIFRLSLFSLMITVGPAVYGAVDPCDNVDAAQGVSNQLKYTTTGETTGLPLGPYISQIYGHSTQITCNALHDETLGAEPVARYVKQLVAPEGTLTQQFWISKKSNRILREDIDGDIPGKGRGHQSGVYHYK